MESKEYNFVKKLPTTEFKVKKVNTHNTSASKSTNISDKPIITGNTVSNCQNNTKPEENKQILPVVEKIIDTKDIKKRSLSQHSNKFEKPNEKVFLAKTCEPIKKLDIFDENFLLNEENKAIVDNYLNKLGIQDKVDFIGNIYKFKIYQKILDDTKLYDPNLNLTEDSAKEEKFNQSVQFKDLNSNIKLIDISNKLLKSHQENSSLNMKIKEMEERTKSLETQLIELKNENSYLSKKLNDFISLQKDEVILRNNQNNINFNFTINDSDNNLIEMKQSIKNLSEELVKLKNFQSNVFDYSKKSEDSMNSVLSLLKNVNMIVEQFNLSGINDQNLKKMIDSYFRKIFI